jgi:thiamine-phosphate pyrophosphorylase
MRLCLLFTRDLCREEPLTVLREAVAGGVDSVQLREKEMADDDFLAWARVVKEECDQLRVPMIINDRVDVAAELQTAGVHLGQDDLSIAEARKLLAPHQWIGLSTHSLDELEDAADQQADYAGFGPMFSTALKPHLRAQSADDVTRAAIFARLPVLAIGGITPDNVESVPRKFGLAVSAAICSANDSKTAAMRLRHRNQFLA